MKKLFFNKYNNFLFIILYSSTGLDNNIFKLKIYKYRVFQDTLKRIYYKLNKLN